MIHGHGGDIYSLARELGISPDAVRDFSSNVSPLSFPAGLPEIIAEHVHEIAFLPDVDSLGLRNALSERYRLRPSSFLVGVGTTEWIFSLPRLLKPDKVVIPLPTYADYADAATLAGSVVETLGPWPEADPESNGEILHRLMKSSRGRSLVYLCNPNNPTGRFIPPTDLADVISASPQATWVVDESYAPFVAPDETSSLLTPELPSNLIVLRSFSKIYDVPGIRLGCAVAPEKLIEVLGAGARPWAVNRLAQVAGEFLLRQKDYEQEVRNFCRLEKSRFLSAMSEIKFLQPVEGATHFILFGVSRDRKASEIARRLRRKGMLIRDCANFAGLSGDHIRISLRSRADNDALIESLKNL